MKLIFAQGNPGAHYARTRHNVGFFIVDTLAKQWGISFSSKPKFYADIAEASHNDEKILLVKPTTFYNETGKAARALIDFYKLNPASDFIVIHDELALPFGTIKTRPDGSDAGNNGVKSLNAHIGSHYHRIRIGVYNPLRDKMDDADFVLGSFSKTETDHLPALFTATRELLTAFLHHLPEPTTVRTLIKTKNPE